MNAAYNLPSKLAVSKTKLQNAAENVVRQVKQVEALFNVMPETIPTFDHFTPASWLISNPDILDADEAAVDATLDRAEQIFKLYNALL